ncbi:MAG: hypothetical protein EOM80_10880 [Erysipelotrichia bacterium]|nr:hypothetical protein [Erysipelotrichia bacterium]
MKTKKIQNYPLRRFFYFIRDSLVGRNHAPCNLPIVNQPVEISVLPSQTEFSGKSSIGVVAESLTDTPTNGSALQSPQHGLFVIWDAIGDGRLVGVFTDEKQVKQIIKLNPNYYRYYHCIPGQPTEYALSWLDETRRIFLKTLCEQDK